MMADFKPSRSQRRAWQQHQGLQARVMAAEDVPADQQKFIKINAELSPKWTSITKRKAALPDAEQWKDVKDKLHELQR